MTTIGFHASHEHLSPGTLLRTVVSAEEAGFQAGGRERTIRRRREMPEIGWGS
jgi:hypothetical protein